MSETKAAHTQELLVSQQLDEVVERYPETSREIENLLSALTDVLGGDGTDIQNLDEVFLGGTSVDGLPAAGKVLEGIELLLTREGKKILTDYIDRKDDQIFTAMVFYLRITNRKFTLDETLQFLRQEVSESLDLGHILRAEKLGLGALLEHVSTQIVGSGSNTTASQKGTAELLSRLTVGAIFDSEESWEWMSRAKCLDINSEVFFPGRGNSAHILEAKRICESCPVSEECLDHALDNDEKYGVWGGLSEREREQLLRSSHQRAS